MLPFGTDQSNSRGCIIPGTSLGASDHFWHLPSCGSKIARKKRVDLNKKIDSLAAEKLLSAVVRMVLRYKNLSWQENGNFGKERVCWRSLYFSEFNPKHVWVV